MNPATVAVNCHTPNLSRLLVGASLGEASITVCKEHWTHPEDPTSVLWFWCTNSCVCCCSVPKSYLTLCKPRDCSMPGFPVLHYLLELAQTHPLSQWCCPSTSFSAALFSFSFSLSQNQGLFQWVGSSHQVAKVLELQLQHQSFQWIFRVDFL